MTQNRAMLFEDKYLSTDIYHMVKLFSRLVSFYIDHCYHVFAPSTRKFHLWNLRFKNFIENYPKACRILTFFDECNAILHLLPLRRDILFRYYPHENLKFPKAGFSKATQFWKFSWKFYKLWLHDSFVIINEFLYEVVAVIKHLMNLRSIIQDTMKVIIRK